MSTYYITSTVLSAFQVIFILNLLTTLWNIIYYYYTCPTGKETNLSGRQTSIWIMVWVSPEFPFLTIVKYNFLEELKNRKWITRGNLLFLCLTMPVINFHSICEQLTNIYIVEKYSVFIWLPKSPNKGSIKYHSPKIHSTLILREKHYSWNLSGKL